MAKNPPNPKPSPEPRGGPGPHGGTGSHGETGPTGGAAADAAALEAGRVLFAQECDFVAGAAQLAQVPQGRLPEVAFAGRSNVGKSSLLNALTGRKSLARVSNTPGRTRQINFFLLGRRLMLADLPGYGFAAVSKSVVAEWTELISAYLRGRPNLRRVMILIDARHGLKDSDHALMDMLDRTAVSYQLVLTKSDKVPDSVCAGVLDEVSASLHKHTACHPDIVVTSAVTGLGIGDLRARLAALTETA